MKDSSQSSITLLAMIIKDDQPTENPWAHTLELGRDGREEGLSKTRHPNDSVVAWALHHEKC